MLVDYRDMIATIATMVTIVQFLSGIDICRRIVKQGSTGDISGFPFVGGVFSTSIWLTYSILLPDFSMAVTNGVGLTLQMLYLLTYIKYCISPGPWYSTRRQMMLLFSIAASLLYYVTLSGADVELVKTRVGIMCCVGSIIFCGAPLISVIEVFHTRSTHMLPFPLIFATFLVTGLWWMYGIIIDNNFVQYPNLMGCVLSGLQLLLFVIFPAKGNISGDSRAV